MAARFFMGARPTYFDNATELSSMRAAAAIGLPDRAAAAPFRIAERPSDRMCTSQRRQGLLT